MKKNTLFLSIFTMFIPNGYAVTENPVSTPHVTIWIHGTRGSAFLPIHASKTLTLIEHEVALCPQGLTSAADLPTTYHQQRIAHILATIDHAQFPFENFYCFGWSGDLDPVARIIAAEQLYQELIQLIDAYKTHYGCAPYITLITHSHGGNVALNLAKISTGDISIDRLILLACPVQEETRLYIDHPLFKQRYSLHSHTDMVQVLDVQKLHPFRHIHKKIKKKRSLSPLKKAFKESAKLPLFSHRHFKAQIPLKQVSIRWEYTKPWNEEDIAIFSHFRKFIRTTFGKLQSQRGLLHLEFLLPSFLQELPGIIKTVDHHKLTKQDIEIKI